VVVATFGLVFGSVYSLIMIHRAYFGPARAEHSLRGMNGRELGMAMSLAILLVLLGVYPQPILDTSAATMQGVQSWLDTAFTQLASAR
jgi:NADH-quinone oxidoreductase subunit M